MFNKFFLVFLNCFLNNSIIINIKSKKFNKNVNNSNFANIEFENLTISKNVFLSKKNPYKEYNEKSLEYHNFNWLAAARKIGGIEAINLAKKHIFLWQKNKYSLFSFAWNNEIIAKRIINLFYHYDFFATSSNDKEKKILLNIIAKNYFILDLNMNIEKKITEYSLEVAKSLLLFKLIFNLNTSKIINSIKKHLLKNIDGHGVHISMNPCYHAEYINNLYEIKNIMLYFKISLPDEINYQILNMTSSLIKFFHKNNSIALFNGANNSNLIKVKKISQLSKDIKAKDLHKINNGIAIFENKNLKIFFDVTKPNVKLISQNLHAGTLGFEISCKNEKIITNCGSIEKRGIKKLNYLRYSAAHSTIILNNTNISELGDRKSYKRVPENVLFNHSLNDRYLIWQGNHDGYKKNFNKLVSRKLFVDQNNFIVIGEDSIISTKITTKDILYDIRFHLTPDCKASLTRGKNRILIMTKMNNSFIFESDANLKLDDSVYVEDGKKIEKTSQIVISGFVNSFKKTIKWKITKA